MRVPLCLYVKVFAVTCSAKRITGTNSTHITNTWQRGHQSLFYAKIQTFNFIC